MSVIPHDNHELLTHILGDVFNKSYIEVVQDVQQQITETCELIDVPVFHHFAPNVYMRQMDAKAGTIMVTKMHKTEHFLIILKGSASVLSDDGLAQFSEHQIIRTMPHTKRVIYFHEDSSWMTIHPTSLTDLADIEAELIEPEGVIL